MHSSPGWPKKPCFASALFSCKGLVCHFSTCASSDFGLKFGLAPYQEILVSWRWVTLPSLMLESKNEEFSPLQLDYYSQSASIRPQTVVYKGRERVWRSMKLTLLKLKMMLQHLSQLNHCFLNLRKRRWGGVSIQREGRWQRQVSYFRLHESEVEMPEEMLLKELLWRETKTDFLLTMALVISLSVLRREVLSEWKLVWASAFWRSLAWMATADNWNNMLNDLIAWALKSNDVTLELVSL